MRVSVFILCLFCAVILQNISAQDASTIVSWDEEHIDLGAISKGDQIENQYTFTNISKESVEIDLVSTCECTEATWTQGEIGPGEKGVIKFIFDSNQKDKAEPVDVDVYFLNVNASTKRPYSAFLTYTFKFSE